MRAWRAASPPASVSCAKAPAQSRAAARPRAKWVDFMRFSWVSGAWRPLSGNRGPAGPERGGTWRLSSHQRRLEVGPDQRAAVDRGRAWADDPLDEPAAPRGARRDVAGTVQDDLLRDVAAGAAGARDGFGPALPVVLRRVGERPSHQGRGTAGAVGPEAEGGV